MFVAFQALQGSRPSALQDLSGTFTAELHRGSRCFSSSRVHTAGLEFLPWLKEPKSNSRTLRLLIELYLPYVQFWVISGVLVLESAYPGTPFCGFSDYLVQLYLFGEQNLK